MFNHFSVKGLRKLLAGHESNIAHYNSCMGNGRDDYFHGLIKEERVKQKAIMAELLNRRESKNNA